MLEALQTLLDNGLNEKAILPIVNDLFEGNGIEDDEDVKRLALLYHRAKWGGDFDCNIEAAKYDDCILTVDNEEYLVLDEGEKETRWDDALESYLDDGCIEGADGPYFDREAWKRDARFDGAGHCLAGYDGAEEEVDTSKAGAGRYYIYRIN
jgi:hypothetical protein